MELADAQELLERAYQLFNARDVDTLLTMMTDDVEWPDVARSAVLHGKAAVRSYWESQFEATSPHVEPIDFLLATDGSVVVVVDQQVNDLDGQPIIPRGEVYHRYAFNGLLVRRMTVFSDMTAAVAIPPAS
jgi:ketosteroid isomerase-like protein